MYKTYSLWLKIRTMRMLFGLFLVEAFICVGNGLCDYMIQYCTNIINKVLAFLYLKQINQIMIYT